MPASPQVPTSVAPWREPVRGGYPGAQHFARAGIDQLRALISGEVPAPPISRLTGMRIVAAEPRSAAFEMPMTGWLYSQQGVISIGPLAMAADAAVACAIQTELPPATPFTTSELSLRLLAPVEAEGQITARGQLIAVGRTIGLADVGLTNSRDELVAHGSSLCLLRPQLDPTALQMSDPAPRDGAEPAPSGPDPYERQVQGEPIDPAVWAKKAGIDVLRAQLAGELPKPPIHYLTGIDLTAVDEREVRCAMPASEWLCAPARGRIQGGAVALMADTAIGCAIQARLPAGYRAGMVDLKVNYVRPLAADGRPTGAAGHVVHSGRTLALGVAEVLDADGNSVAHATGSAMLLPSNVEHAA